MKNKNLSNQKLYSLLYVINNNSNIKRLIHIGLTYSEIADIIKTLLEEKLILNQEKLELTESGKKLFHELESEYKNTEKDKWIEKEKKSKIDKIDKDFIYLPDPKELYF